uniref:Uncharacterized protein n=1 Tax=Guillardia theta (strain CCMP2712) TaxID=905079 RepID=A0A0C3UAP1_GUITC
MISFDQPAREEEGAKLAVPWLTAPPGASELRVCPQGPSRGSSPFQTLQHSG